ncbi:thiolase family protein [Marivivens donghaensis]|uniref:Thiolase family protein n=1 Tax=Marivivens donghaensis TaxID=1699413 RepID=A0ABX0W0E3_9RHOB|nr:thiolase family protein [Marivivens donghaensis]NIY73808.1 thiolase family protein [Marivivens donghaensis]
MTAFITAARRTIVAPKGGALSAFSLHDLAAPVISAVLEDAGLTGHDVDEVIVSNAIGGGGNPARLCALAAGLPERIAGLSIDRQCAGGLDAIGLAAAMVNSGQARVVIAGGVESHSRRPLRYAQNGEGPPIPYDRPPFTPWADRDPDLTVAADSLGISRERQDVWAIDSHAKAMAARDHLRGEVVPLGPDLDDPFTRKLAPRVVARAPVITGSVTTATTAVTADAAAFVVVTNQATARALRIDGYKSVGGDPVQPGLAPIAAINALGQADRYEIMEAYAAQAIACVEGALIAPEAVNPNGGALARGHPIGASGTILAVRLFHDLQDQETGIAAIAAAGGIGSAIKLTAVN